jgi:hypothetical protein
MDFKIQLEKITAGERGTDGIIFDFMLDNYQSRTTTILSYEFHLLLSRPTTGEVSFLDMLLPELNAGFEFQMKFTPSEKRYLRLAWHYTPRQLQQVEDWRRDKGPDFELRSRLSVVSIWPGQGGKPQEPTFSGEKCFSNGSYPMRFSVPQDQWASVLDQIGFRHIVLYELPMPPLPPGFSRAEEYLREAWDHHRAGRKDETLLACRKAFEPLAYNLFGDDRLSRETVLARLMTQAGPEKRTEVVKLWGALQDLLSNIGVHERGKPVELTKADSELAAICTTAFIGYLAKQK